MLDDVSRKEAVHLFRQFVGSAKFALQILNSIAGAGAADLERINSVSSMTQLPTPIST
jgi:hypothetical protein